MTYDSAWFDAVRRTCGPVFTAAGFTFNSAGPDPSGTQGFLLWEAEALDFAARYPDSGIEESYGPEQWPARCIDYWTYLDRPGHARLCYEGWGFSDELVPLTGDPDADAAALAAAWARILRVDQMPA